MLVTAYNGSKNREVIRLKPDGNTDGLDISQDGYIDMSSPAISKVIFVVEGSHISSDTDSIDIVDDTLEIEFGDLGLESGQYDNGLLLMYIQNQTDPIVVAGAGLRETIILSVKTIPAIN